MDDIAMVMQEAKNEVWTERSERLWCIRLMEIYSFAKTLLLICMVFEGKGWNCKLIRSWEFGVFERNIRIAELTSIETDDSNGQQLVCQEILISVSTHSSDEG